MALVSESYSTSYHGRPAFCAQKEQRRVGGESSNWLLLSFVSTTIYTYIYKQNRATRELFCLGFWEVCVCQIFGSLEGLFELLDVYVGSACLYNFGIYMAQRKRWVMVKKSKSGHCLRIGQAYSISFNGRHIQGSITTFMTSAGAGVCVQTWDMIPVIDP